ncbi:MAG: pentapeptide repeat-containing protein, partial [Dehalococcoidia bacterium]|nr:pentapeptide repeat-containing protein [Dehalococcoidia bacterium]
DLEGADLQGADLIEANLQRAHLWGADLQRADLGGADLQRANLEWAKLERVDLTVAGGLTGIRWYGAVLDKTRMRREQLGEKIGDELAAKQGKGTYNQAREAYLALKTNFNELGRYDDASWAYRKERRMERAMSRRWGWKWWGDSVAEWLTDYGENPWLAIRAVLITWAVFGLLYSSVGTIGPADLLKADPVKIFDPGAIFSGLTYSAAALGTVGLESLRPLDRLTEVLTALEGIVGISLLALLMFTLGNRISRS